MCVRLGGTVRIGAASSGCGFGVAYFLLLAEVCFGVCVSGVRVLRCSGAQVS